MKRVIPMAVAISVGVVVLLDRFVANVYLDGLGLFFMESAVIVAAFAALLGFFNVLGVHSRKIGARAYGWPYSVILVLASIGVVAVGYSGPASPLLRQMFNYVQYPLQSTIASLLIFFVVTAAVRAVRIRGWESLVFVVVVLIVLVGQIPLSREVTAAKDWIVTVPGLAGVRGLVLGVALGTVVTGLRVLMGIDRPYTG